MIYEITEIRIAPGQQDAFDEALTRALETVMSNARGMRRYRVDKGIESPERYVLQIVWDTLEDHTVHFRKSSLLAQWRSIIGPYFAGPPVVEHFMLVTESPQ